ncbi:MAG: Stp1/IreP family PP2C-type Ser/Thr phosphatase [Oscillospiraceae bacterium]|nr:Stp1/IreP family PP2C-type Ser/Thr phosphatase [Oscillospiraceae bacterium]
MQIWSHTDKGVSRKQNQDYLLIETLREDSYALCAVCDGMGGARAGNIASETACRTFIEETRLSLKPSMSDRSIRQALASAVQIANKKVFDQSRSKAEYYGMGTTLVGGIVMPARAVIVNVGDSRGYLIDTDGIRRVTRDHSLVEDLVERGDLSLEEAKHHPKRNLITRALGTEIRVESDLFSLKLEPGNFVLLCSDGLTNVVEEQEILYEILHGGDAEGGCRRLVDMANRRGGPDNITVVLIRI